jgi:hypothetical protein
VPHTTACPAALSLSLFPAQRTFPLYLIANNVAQIWEKDFVGNTAALTCIEAECRITDVSEFAVASRSVSSARAGRCYDLHMYSSPIPAEGSIPSSVKPFFTLNATYETSFVSPDGTSYAGNDFAVAFRMVRLTSEQCAPARRLSLGGADADRAGLDGNGSTALDSAMGGVANRGIHEDGSGGGVRGLQECASRAFQCQFTCTCEECVCVAPSADVAEWIEDLNAQRATQDLPPMIWDQKSE